MCLFTNDKKPRVATHDIPVWKFLLEDDSAPFKKYTYKRGENRPNGPDDVFGTPYTKQVKGGWLHAFYVDPESTRGKLIIERANELFLADGRSVKVAKMYIPAGEQYYIGIDLDICSKCLVWPDDETEK